MVRGGSSAEILGKPVHVRTRRVSAPSQPFVDRANRYAVAGPKRLPVGVYFSTIFGNGAGIWQNMTGVLGHNPLTVEAALRSGEKFQVRAFEHRSFD